MPSNEFTRDRLAQPRRAKRTLEDEKEWEGVGAALNTPTMPPFKDEHVLVSHACRP